MAIVNINLGTTAGDKTGTKARAAGQIINDNFAYLEAKIDNVNYLSADAGYVLEGQTLTFNPNWLWTIEGVVYSNPAAVAITIPLAASGYSRIDLIVANTSNTFTRVAGVPSLTTPVSPVVPANTIFVVFYLVDSEEIAAPLVAGPQVPVTQTIRENVTSSAPSEDVVYKALEEKVDNTSLVNTAFNNVAYAATISRTHNPSAPNIEIDITGNLNLSITGTVNGDSGLVNLYFSAAQTATLNGFSNLVITGAGAMIPVYFIHDGDGLKWYQNAALQDVQSVLDKGNSVLNKSIIFTGDNIYESTVIDFYGVGITGNQDENGRYTGCSYTSNGFAIQTNTDFGTVLEKVTYYFNGGIKTITPNGNSSTDNYLDIPIKSGMLATLDDIDASRPYKVYTALLNQTGTNAPVATILENTIVGSLIWSRNATGSYQLLGVSNAFSFNKTVLFITRNSYNFLSYLSIEASPSNDSVFLAQRRFDNSGSVDGLTNIPIEIRVYN